MSGCPGRRAEAETIRARCRVLATGSRGQNGADWSSDDQRPIDGSHEMERLASAADSELASLKDTFRHAICDQRSGVAADDNTDQFFDRASCSSHNPLDTARHLRCSVERVAGAIARATSGGRLPASRSHRAPPRTPLDPRGLGAPRSAHPPPGSRDRRLRDRAPVRPRRDAEDPAFVSATEPPWSCFIRRCYRPPLEPPDTSLMSRRVAQNVSATPGHAALTAVQATLGRVGGASAVVGAARVSAARVGDARVSDAPRSLEERGGGTTRPPPARGSGR